MVDQVGRDPFKIEKIVSAVKDGSIKKAAALAKCGQLQVEDMDLSLIQSTGTNNSSGIRRERMESVTNGSARGNLSEMAKQVCVGTIQKLETFPNGAEITITRGEGSRNQFLRHKGNKDPACVFEEAPKIQGEECINECLQNYI